MTAAPGRASPPSFAERHWQHLTPLSIALSPLSLVFRAGVALRRAAFRTGLFRSERLPVGVVVVGNLVVGGTGKTPLVLWLVRELERRGYRPGIVSRGYGGAAEGPEQVPPRGDPSRFGDEPVLLAERSGVPVFVGRDRVAAGHALLAAHPDRDAIVCDDGLQHYRLARDFEIAVEDARGRGNGLLLPAGPLREPGSRQVDALVLNGVDDRRGFTMTLEPAGFRAVTSGASVDPATLRARRLHAVAAIGNPSRFFATLRGLGLEFTAHAFPDHHRFVPSDLAFEACDAVLMTEKDAVKCRGFERDDLFALRVDARVDPALADCVVARLPHGPQAA